MIDKKYVMKTGAQITQLRDVCGSMKTIDVESPHYKALEKMLDGMDCQTLAIIVAANIRFLSVLARNRLDRAGLTADQVSRGTWGNPYVAQALAIPAEECRRHAMVSLRNRCTEDGDTFCGACVMVFNARR